MAIVTIVAFASAIGAKLCSDEIKAWLPWLTRRLIAKAIGRLPNEHRARYAEEWESHLLEVPGDMGKLIYSLGLSGAASKISHVTRSVGLSSFAAGSVKRVFDCICVLASLPIVAPLLLLTAILVRLTSAGPILFLQERIGRNGQAFTILKFRTMVHDPASAHHPIAISNEQRFTKMGPFLRRWKLDELPQLINVLLGDMSLVGPRAKMREHVMYDLPCRPGITGCATIVFAREDKILDSVSKDRLNVYFHSVVLPAKHGLDAEYMAHATLLSDLRIIVKSVLRRWDTEALDEFIVMTALDAWDSAPRREVDHNDSEGPARTKNESDIKIKFAIASFVDEIAESYK